MKHQHTQQELAFKAGKALHERGRENQRDAEWESERGHLPRPEGAPYWLPRGLFWERLSDGLQRAVGEILIPAYQRLVIDAKDELERSAGISLVHLMWLEICDQAAMSNTVGDRDWICSKLKDPEAQIAQHIQLLGAKNNAAELLLKLRMLRETFQRGEQPLGPPLCVPSLPVPPPPQPVPTSDVSKTSEASGMEGVATERRGPDSPPPPEGTCGRKEPEIGES